LQRDRKVTKHGTATTLNDVLADITELYRKKRENRILLNIQQTDICNTATKTITIYYNKT